MNIQESTSFLLTMVTEIKRSFDSPVILLTMRDYAENIVNSMIAMRSAQLNDQSPEAVAELVGQVHLDWLQAVTEVDAFKKHIRETAKSYISKAIDFTIESVTKRHKNFHIYAAKFPQQGINIQDDIKHLEEVQQNVISVLCDKQKCLHILSDSTELYHRVYDESEELMNWLDMMYDNLAVLFCSTIVFKTPILNADLTRTLEQIINEIPIQLEPSNQKVNSLIELTCDNLNEDEEMKNIVDKIQNLQDRIDRLKHENSSAVIALQHRSLFLEERLLSLENLKSAMCTLKHRNSHQHGSKPKLHIFDHLLPQHQRCRLVEELVGVWNEAIHGNREGQSIISILSVTDIKETFSDEIGKFTVDKYGRKVYKGDEGSFYQLNESNQLVLLKDDEKHVFFYDDCGRYYINDDKERIYTAHETASEYFINHDGLLLKLKEYRNGKEYWYDNLGCYIISETGKKMYFDRSQEYFEHDGLGNLVRIRSRQSYENLKCPPEPVVTEESKYLQRTVGDALKKCLADVVLHQPSDPILYLAIALENFWNNVDRRVKRLAVEKEITAEREVLRREDEKYNMMTAPASLSIIEENDSDINMDLNQYQGL